MDNSVAIAIGATAGLAAATLGASVKGYLDRRAGTDDELRSVRVKAYPPVWRLTSALSFRPGARLTYSELRSLDDELHDWYYGTGGHSSLQESPGGLYLSENARARYGDLRNLITARLKNMDGEEAVPGFVYEDLRTHPAHSARRSPKTWRLAESGRSGARSCCIAGIASRNVPRRRAWKRPS